MWSIREKKSVTLSGYMSDTCKVCAKGEHVPLNINWDERYCTLLQSAEPLIDDILNFPIRNDDVFVVTMPKSGTTWMQEAAWLILNNLDYERAASIPRYTRNPLLEISSFITNEKFSKFQMVAELPSPRFIGSHLPANLIPKEIWTKKVKIIYVARGPKDVIVSNFYFLHGLGRRDGNLEDFVQDFIANDIAYTPYWQNVLDFWQMRNEPHVFFTTYEEMKRDLSGVLKKLTKFLEKPDLKEDELLKLIDHLSFDKMKASWTSGVEDLINRNVKDDYSFMRRGIVGSYKDELSDKCIRDIDRWTEDNLAPYQLAVDDIFGK